MNEPFCGPSCSATFEYLDDGPMCMVALNPDFTVARINGTCARYLAPLRKLLNLDFLSLVEEGGGTTQREKLQAALESVTTTQQQPSVRARVRNVQMLTLRDDDSGFPIKRHFDWMVGKGKDGQILLFGDPCSEDDVEQRAKDAELIDFFQNAPIALHWLGGDGKVIWANKTEMDVLGYTEEEYIGQPIMKFCPDEEELVLEIFKQLGSGNTIRDVPVRFRAKDGHIVDLLIDSNVKYDAQGNFSHTRCFIRDDTKRKIHEAKAALLLDETKRSLKMMDNFLSRSMHHLRTPLHVLRNSVDLVLDHLGQLGKKPRMDKATLEMVRDSTNILSRCEIHVDSAITMIDDISDLAKLDQGQQLILAQEPVVLQKLLQELLDTVDFPSKISPKLQVEKTAPRSIDSDAMSLRKVLQHLLEHLAYVALRDGVGEIVLRVCNDNGRCCFETVHRAPTKIPVHYDTMDLDLDTSSSSVGLPAIFQRYHQEFIPESTTDWAAARSLRDKIEAGINSHRENGIGIGLSLSYHIVAALGGDLRYDSDPAHGLTKFWFSLPHNEHSQSESLVEHVIDLPPQQQPSKRRKIVDDDDANPVAFSYTKENVAAKGVQAMDPPSVLVVEDTPMCAKLICRTLNKLNVPTKWATNGQEAIDMLKSEGSSVFNLILMDLRMPVMDGFEATKIIKHELKLQIPVIALTGETGDDVKKQCDEIGFDEFKQKPMKMNELIHIVQHHTGFVSPQK